MSKDLSAYATRSAETDEQHLPARSGNTLRSRLQDHVERCLGRLSSAIEFWPSSADGFWPTLRSLNPTVAPTESGDLAWTGKPKWICSSNFVGSMSSGSARSRVLPRSLVSKIGRASCRESV